MPTYQVTAEEHKNRLDRVLQKVMNLTRAQVQKIIHGGDVTLNKKPVTPHLAVRTGDLLFYPALSAPKPQAKIIAPTLEIIYEDGDVLVINKPAGLLVHPVNENRHEPTVIDGLLALHPEIAKVGDDPRRPGLVQRLDKDVSGVMIIAKNAEAFSWLKKQFADRLVKKEYLGLAYGQISKTHDTITLKIARSKNKGRMVARPQSQEGKEAVTEYDVLEKFKTATYVRVRIHTGRTHQIRTHFKAIDHPLVGDSLYKKNHMKNIHPIPMNRIFLHAHQLTVTLLSGQEKTFAAPLPAELKKILSLLSKV